VIETTDTGAIRFIGDDYYLEDLRVDLSAIGVFDFQTRSFVIPTPGSQTTFVMEGDFGSRTTYTYSAYDWSVE
jgi:hypothetical protein